MRLLLSFLLLLFYLPLMAQEMGRPFIQNFSPRKYKADGQNWVIEQDNRGFIYVGNTAGLLEYDGENWRKIPTPEDARIIWMDTAPDGTLFLSSSTTNGEFGKLEPGKNGELQYKSLLTLADTAFQNPGYILRVWASEDYVYMNNSFFMLRFDRKAQKFEKVNYENRLGTSYRIDDTIIINTTDGWQKVDGLELLPMPNADNLRNYAIRSYLPYDDENYLLVAGRGEQMMLYNKENGQMSPLPNQVGDFLQENRFLHALRLANGTFAFSTATGGIITMNSKGRRVSVVNKQIGLQDNEIYHIFQDNQNGVWVGTGNGVARIELLSPFSRWYDEVGGWTTTVTRHDGTVYAGALGLRYLTEDGFKLVNGVNPTQQAWTLYEYETPGLGAKKLLYGSAEGIHIVEGTEAKLLPGIEGSVMSFHASKKNPNRLYAGGNGTLHILNYNNGEWKLMQQVDTEGAEIRSMQEDANGNLWAATYHEGVRHLQLPTINGELQEPIMTSYGPEQGLPDLKYNRVYSVDDDIVFTTQKGIFTFNEGKKVFLPHPKYAHLFNDKNRDAFLLSQDADKNVWVAAFKTTEQPYAQLVSNETSDKPEWYDVPFRRLPGMETEVMHHDENGTTWLGGSEGLIKYDPALNINYERPYNTYIRRIMLGEDSVYFRGTFFEQSAGGTNTLAANQPKAELVELPYKLNSLTFDYAAPFYDDNEEANEYRYFLEGYQEHWSDWTSDTRRGYTNLPAGDYVFRVQAKNTYGMSSEEATFRFSILAPWYLTPWAIGGYVLLAGLVIFGAVKLNSRRLKAQNRLLENTVEARTAEIAERKDEIERAYSNIKTISDIGQNITGTLDMQQLVERVYTSVNQLMPAEAFGVGLHDADMNRLDFVGFIEKGERLPISYDYLNDNSKLSAYCFNNMKEVFINDLDNEYNSYTGEQLPKADIGEIPQSVIFLPLEFEGKALGVITVQSFKKNAYSRMELTLLRTLASYVSIALSNTSSYGQLERVNLQITDSIRYAETIQKAVLPSMERMNEVLHDYFVIYRPKDIVSGDFYWFSHTADRIYMAVVDCTGHGVPGAFMSMIGSSLLSEIVNVERIYEPNKILEQLHMHVRDSLRQREKKNTDGMDICLISLQATTDYKLEVKYSGAKMPLYYTENGDLHELKPTKKSIGGMQREPHRVFEQHTLIMESGEKIYMASDGIIDQNAPNRSKYGSLRLKELLRSNMHRDLQDQHEVLLTSLDEHMKEAPQRDDVTIIGIQI